MRLKIYEGTKELSNEEKVMKEKFPEQVRDMYISYVHKEAERVSDRKRDFSENVSSMYKDARLNGYERD